MNVEEETLQSFSLYPLKIKHFFFQLVWRQETKCNSITVPGILWSMEVKNLCIIAHRYLKPSLIFNNTLKVIFKNRCYLMTHKEPLYITISYICFKNILITSILLVSFATSTFYFIHLKSLFCFMNSFSRLQKGACGRHKKLFQNPTV